MSKIQETFDVPCISGLSLDEQRGNPKQQKLEKEAEEFLVKEASKFGAEVHKKYNPHDFGMYPSFELFVDEPHDIDSCLDCEDDLPCKGYDDDPNNEKYDALWDSINTLHKAYYEKFEEYL